MSKGSQHQRKATDVSHTQLMPYLHLFTPIRQAGRELEGMGERHAQLYCQSAQPSPACPTADTQVVSGTLTSKTSFSCLQEGVRVSPRLCATVYKTQPSILQRDARNRCSMSGADQAGWAFMQTPSTRGLGVRAGGVLG